VNGVDQSYEARQAQDAWARQSGDAITIRELEERVTVLEAERTECLDVLEGLMAEGDVEPALAILRTHGRTS
jgi:hypothetical protein